MKIRKIRQLQLAAGAIALPGALGVVLGISLLVGGLRSTGSDFGLEEAFGVLFLVPGSLHLFTAYCLWDSQIWATLCAKILCLLWILVWTLVFAAGVWNSFFPEAVVGGLVVAYCVVTMICTHKGAKILDYEREAAEWDKTEPRAFTPVMPADQSIDSDRPK